MCSQQAVETCSSQLLSGCLPWGSAIVAMAAFLIVMYFWKGRGSSFQVTEVKK